jgi:SAM-dependent methyltransferase
VLRERVFPQLGGLDWFSFLREKCGPLPREDCLSLCCGDGSVERHLVKAGICRACEGVDISPAAIEVCQQEAESTNLSTLTYRVLDVEHARLPVASYDLVIGWMALHHIQNLSQLFRQVKRALRPGGLFVINEYVGPVRFQLPEAQEAMIDEWVRKLPARLRVASDGQMRDGWTRPNVEDMIRIDPSEAVRSDQILPELEREFVTVERIDYGGGLLQWVLHDITQNLDPENAEDVSWLRRLCAGEQELMQQGLLASDFSLVIARPASR